MEKEHVSVASVAVVVAVVVVLGRAPPLRRGQGRAYTVPRGARIRPATVCPIIEVVSTMTTIA